MVINLNVSGEQEVALREAWGADLDRAALEALVIEGYRTGKFGTAQVRRLLGLASRWDAEAWLADRRVPLNYTLEDLDSDRRTLAELFPEPD